MNGGLRGEQRRRESFRDIPTDGLSIGAVQRGHVQVEQAQRLTKKAGLAEWAITRGKTGKADLSMRLVNGPSLLLGRLTAVFSGRRGTFA